MAEKSLSAFVRLAWSYIDPAPWVSGFHIDAVAEHLEAVSRGHIRKLIINQPPRTSKSSMVSVAWPAWTWLQYLAEGEDELFPNMGPKVKFLFASYAATLTERDAVRCRRLIESPWYQKLWGDRYQLTGDVNTKSRYATTAGGERLSTSVDSRLTGEGGQVIVCFQWVTRIRTDAGWLPIGDIVDRKLPVKVLGRDGERLVWQDIEAYETNPGRALVRILFDGGGLTCTDDHPVWVETRGYVGAGSVRPGEAIRTLDADELRSLRERSPSLPESQGALLRLEMHGRQSNPGGAGKEYASVHRLRDASISATIAQPAHAAWPALQSQMSCDPAKGRGQQDVGRRQADCAVPVVQGRLSGKSESGAGSKVLLGILQFQRVLGDEPEEAETKTVRPLPRGISAETALDDLLFDGLCGGVDWPSRSATRRNDVPNKLEARRHSDSGEGRQCVPDVRRGPEGARASGSPHRPRQDELGPAESDYALHSMPRAGSRWSREPCGMETKIVRAVERAGYADATYNLSVGPHHNYFAEGVSCHNCDDPHNVKDALKSEASRENVLTWWDEAMPSRLNDPKTGAFVVVMQRMHENDLTGHILKEDDTLGEWTTLILPMRYESNRHCVVEVTGWEDPRRFDTLPSGEVVEAPDLGEGRLLCPDRFGDEEIARFERNTYLFAGQMQQRPAPRGGGIFKEEWWQHWPPDGVPLVEWQDPLTGIVDMRIPFPDFEYIVASLDTAFEEKKEADFSALTIWGLWRSSGFRGTGGAAARLQAGPAGPEGRFTVHQGGKGSIIPPDVARLQATLRGTGGRSASAAPEDEILIPMSDDENPKLMLMYAWEKKLDLHGPPEEVPPGVSPKEWMSAKWRAHRQKSWGLVEWVVDTCRRHRVDTLLIEKQAAGKPVAQELRRLFNNDGMHVVMIQARGEKVARAYANQHWFSNRIIYAPTELAWCQKVIQQMSTFPKASHDDLTDSTTMMLTYMNQTGMLVRRDEYDSSYQDTLKPKKRTSALYPV